MTRLYRNKRSGKVHMERGPQFGVHPGVAECGANVRPATFERVEIVHDKYAKGGARGPEPDDVTCWQCLDTLMEDE